MYYIYIYCGESKKQPNVWSYVILTFNILSALPLFFAALLLSLGWYHMGVSKNRGEPPNMDGENNGIHY